MEKKKKIAVTRPAFGISLNAGHPEYLLDAENEVMLFDSVERAKDFLMQNGIEEDELDEYNYEEYEG